MNREVLFRGLAKINYYEGDQLKTEQKWVFGSLVKDKKGNYYIVEDVETECYSEEECDLYALGWYKVDKETVGQFTGLYDKNGKEIYEGDILSPRDRDVLFVVIWDNDIASFKFKGRYGVYEIDESILSLEIVGNIHDNPELLEETK